MLKMLKIIITASFTILMSLSAAAADGEKTNCRMESSGNVAIYGGYASCYANGVRLSKYFSNTPAFSQIIREYRNGTYLQCQANIPFSHYETVTREVCDYKPTGSFRLDHHGYSTSFYLNPKDSDGSVVSSKIWLDNVLLSAGYGTVHDYYGQNSYMLKAEIVDNDGHKTTIYKSFQVQSMRDKCGGAGYC
ncbi:MAG: hypothetical protein HRT53_12865 [Colwellia sp.]|nr:hypothetical protein [Colwellia sp.]